ncbi:MAG: phosphopyruvate hydratase [Candidatus Kerfeldbacteria bacterium]|nr:phosphopyruvate hydratase [Candidatus Kerfeldbacteria bacterium]
MNTTIQSIRAREILDSRGDPTLEVGVKLESGIVGIACVPAGKSTGAHEAAELRDHDPKRYHGMGVLKAIQNIETVLSPKLHGEDVEDLRRIDRITMGLDETPNKSQIGANALVGVSLACARAGANARNGPLHAFIRHVYELDYLGHHLPRPLMNIINGGKHADNHVSIQEFHIIPNVGTIHEMIRMGAETLHELQKLLMAQHRSTLLGDEGGVAPTFSRLEEAFELILKAGENAHYRPGKDFSLGIDAAASEWFDRSSGTYHPRKPGETLTSKEVIQMYQKWCTDYPLVLIEDGLAEDDWGGWQRLTKALKRHVNVIGDDVFVTNIERINRGVQEGVADGVIIKPNQIGTLSEAIDVIEFAQMNDYMVIVSHRSGETNDTSIVDIAIAVQADFLKAGAPERGERVAKYNRLMEMEGKPWI